MRRLAAYGLLVAVAAVGFYRTEQTLHAQCRSVLRAWDVNDAQNRILTEPSSIGPALAAAYAAGDPGAKILVSQVESANARKASEKVRLDAGLAERPTC